MTRVLMRISGFLGGRQRNWVYVNISVVDGHTVNGDWLKSREILWLAGRELKFRAVGPAFQGVVFDESFGERNLSVTAGVPDRMDNSGRVFDDSDRNTLDGYL
jgi:hypothetical protein